MVLHSEQLKNYFYKTFVLKITNVAMGKFYSIYYIWGKGILYQGTTYT
jgi:hypothetical protein